MSWWSNPFVARAQDWVYGPLAAGQPPRAAIRTNEHYVRVSLVSMRIVNVRKGTSKFHGAVHSAIALLHRSGDPAQFSRVIVPSFLKNVDAARLDRVITLRKPLAGWAPYRGGDLEVEIGLFSVKAVDMAESFLNLLDQIGGLAAVPYLSAALPFMPLMKLGFDLLTGSDDASMLEVGLSATYSAPETGYYVVMRAPKGTVDVQSLTLDANDFRVLGAAGQPVADFPYLVFQIEAEGKRDDWFNIPDILKAHQSLNDDVRSSRYKAARESLAVFRRTVLTCDDLIFAHAEKLYAAVEAETNKILGMTQTGRGDALQLRPLDQVDPFT
jgi:hypothetical protein